MPDICSLQWYLFGTYWQRNDIGCSITAVSHENRPWGGRKTLAGTYKALSNIGKLTLGSGYNSSWYIWSWGVSDSGLEQVIAKRQKMLLSRSTGVRALTQKKIALYKKGCRHFAVKFSWSSKGRAPQNMTQNIQEIAPQKRHNKCG